MRHSASNEKGTSLLTARKLAISADSAALSVLLQLRDCEVHCVGVFHLVADLALYMWCSSIVIGSRDLFRRSLFHFTSRGWGLTLKFKNIKKAAPLTSCFSKPSFSPNSPGHLRHAQVVRVDLQVRGRDRPLHPQHPGHRLVHPRLQRYLQRHRPHAPGLQRHRPLRRPGGQGYTRPYLPMVRSGSRTTPPAASTRW